MLLHYGQFVIDGRFHQFDYMSPQLNYHVYSQPSAPDYPLNKITSKSMVFFRGPNDPFCTKPDFDHFLSRLSGEFKGSDNSSFTPSIGFKIDELQQN